MNADSEVNYSPAEEDYDILGLYILYVGGNAFGMPHRRDKSSFGFQNACIVNDIVIYIFEYPVAISGIIPPSPHRILATKVCVGDLGMISG